MLRKIILIFTLGALLLFSLYYAFVYYATYSEGFRSGELIKISNKGVVFKTWEGEISQGISGAQIFKFSILDKDVELIEQMKAMQGQYVKVSYVEKYRTFPWLGDTNYFITEVVKDESPIKIKVNE